MLVERLKKLEKAYKFFIILVDLLIINISYIIVFYIRFNGTIPEFNFKSYINAVPYITISALIYFDVYELVKFYKKTLYDLIVSIFLVVTMLGITTVAITYFLQGFSFPRTVLVITPFVQLVFLTGWKLFLLKIRPYIISTKKLLIIGHKNDASELAERIGNENNLINQQVAYIISPDEIKKILSTLMLVDEVIICSNISLDTKNLIISNCIGSRKVVYVIPKLYEISLYNSKIIQFGDVPALMIDKMGFSPEQKFVKRLFDIIVSLVGIIITFPIMMIAVIAVKLTTNGPAIYVQERVTEKDKVYKMYKIRTMYHNSEEQTGPVISGANDPRVTSVGKILRKYRIDELPQFFNVLFGDMSIVGPRSERPYFVEKFEKDIPSYSYRSFVKAGITGFAQVLGDYDTLPEDKLRYDLIYIKKYSIFLDIKIILQTLKVILLGNIKYKKNYSGKI